MHGNMQVVCAEPDEGTKSASALCFRARCDAVSLLTPRAWSMARVDAARRDTHKKGGVKETQEPDKVIATTDSGTGHAANHGDSVAAAAAGAAGDGGGGGIGIASGSGGGGGGGGGQLQRAVQTLLLPPQLGLTWLPTRGALMQPRTGCCARRRR
jgi:hypothetical protein